MELFPTLAFYFVYLKISGKGWLKIKDLNWSNKKGDYGLIIAFRGDSSESKTLVNKIFNNYIKMLELDIDIQEEILDDFLLSLNLPEDMENIFVEVFNKVCSVENTDISIKNISDRANVLSKINKFIGNIENERVAGNPLRKTQKQAIIGLQNWLIRNIDKKSLMGHVVQPPSLGKTNISVLFSQFFEGKKIYISNDNIGTMQAQKAFNNHLLSLVGEKEAISNDDIIISGFVTFEKYLNENKLDLKNIGVIFVDEVDVNALSEKRSKKLKSIGMEFGFPIIGLTATEIQGTGKTIDKVFPGNIMSLPLPESLPYCLEHKLVPDMKFLDVYLDADLYVSKKDIDRNIGDNIVDSFFNESNWVNKVLDFHFEKFPDKNFIIAFRNNKINKHFIEESKKRGIEVVSLDGSISIEKRSIVIERFKKGEISLVGSKLVGRGLDTPECDVYYNSSLTYSPQLFWQLLGRNMRLDENNPDKKAVSITFLPKKIIDSNTNEVFSKGLSPLCSASFFYKDYYTNIKNDFPNSFNLSLIKPGDIKSIQSIMHTIQSVRKHGGVMKGKLDLVSEAASRSEITGYMSAQNIITASNKYLLNIIDEGKYFEEYKKSDDEKYLTEEDIYYINYYLEICNKKGTLYSNVEKKLILSYMETGKLEFRNELLEYSLSSIVEIIKGLYINLKKKVPNTELSLSDLINEGCIAFLGGIDKFEPSKKGRVTKFALINMLGVVSSHFNTKGLPIFYIPSNKGERIMSFLNDDRKNGDFTNILPNGYQEKLKKVSLEKIKLLERKELIEKEFVQYFDKYINEDYLISLSKTKIDKIKSMNIIDLIDFILKINGGINSKKTKILYGLKKGKISYSEDFFIEPFCFDNENYSFGVLFKNDGLYLDKLSSKIKNYTFDFKQIKNEIQKTDKAIENIDLDLININQYMDLISSLIDEKGIENHDNLDEDICIGNYFTDEDFIATKRKEIILTMLTTLTPREAKVLKMTFGLLNDVDLSKIVVGKIFEVTPARIDQIEAKGLRKLRHPSRAGYLRDFLD